MTNTYFSYGAPLLCGVPVFKYNRAMLEYL